MRNVSRTLAATSRGSSRLNRSKSRSSWARTGGSTNPGGARRRAPVERQRGDQLADRGPVFEAVPAPPAHEPRIRGRRVAIDDEVLVGRVLVLAHAGLDERGALQAREPKRQILARRPHGVRCRQEVGPRVSSATLKPRHSFPGIPYMKCVPWSAQTGKAVSVKRASPGGVPKKNTSCRVARTRSPITSGNSFPSHGPQAKTNASAPRVEPSESVRVRSSPPVGTAGSTASWRYSPP